MNVTRQGVGRAARVSVLFALGLGFLLAGGHALDRPGPVSRGDAAVRTAGAASLAVVGQAQVDQVSAGQAAYAQWCALCHGPEGEGGVGPALVGRGRLSGYGTAARLYEYTRSSMPIDAPGSLGETPYYDIIAFLLDKNGLNGGQQPVTPATAAGLSLAN